MDGDGLSHEVAHTQRPARLCLCECSHRPARVGAPVLLLEEGVELGVVPRQVDEAHRHVIRDAQVAQVIQGRRQARLAHAGQARGDPTRTPRHTGRKA